MKRLLQSYTITQRIVLLMFILVVIPVSLSFIFLHKSPSCTAARFDETTTILPDGTQLKTTVSDTIIARSKGLSICESLGDDQAMLFVFPKSDVYSFWMKDMNISIDILWLNEKKEIVYIHEHAHPEDYKKGTSYVPDALAKYVLETVDGFVDKKSLKIGDTLSW